MRYALLVCLAACSNQGSNPIPQYAVDPEAIRRACAMEVSCFASPPPLMPGGNCVSQFELGLASGFGIFFGPSASDIARYVQCAGSSSKCSDALSCASRNHGSDWCAAHANGGCDGDLLIHCVGGWGLEQSDCSATGLHCATANGASSCSDGISCDPSVEDHCDGNRFVTCDSVSKLQASYECGAFGGTCQHVTMGSQSVTGCLPASGSCGVDGTTCDGTTMVVCEFGFQSRVECAKFASHCAAAANGQLGCVPDASDCGSTTPDSCDGSALRMCVNGKLEATPCSSIGFTGCGIAGGIAVCM
jgi:hypothetical protein